MEAITNTTNEQKCNQNIPDVMPALYAFALQQQVPVSDTFCWHSQHSSPGAVCLHTCIKLYDHYLFSGLRFAKFSQIHILVKYVT